MELPLLQLELLSVRESFMQRFTANQELFKEKVEAAVGRAFEGFDVQREVEAIVQGSLREIVEEAVEANLRRTAYEVVHAKITEAMA